MQLFVLKPLNNSNSDKVFRGPKTLQESLANFSRIIFAKRSPKKTSNPSFWWTSCSQIWSNFRSTTPTFSSKLQPQLFGEIHGNTLFQKHWGKLGYSSAVFLELLGLLNWKTWHISCILLFTVSDTQLSLHTKNCRSNAVSLWQHSLYPNIGAVQQQFLVRGVPCPALHQLKLCSLQDSVPFTTSCPGSLQADWRRAVYVFKHDMHGKSVLPDVFSNLP